jgi:hypothetical protein
MGAMSQTTEKTETQSAEKPGIEQIEELKRRISDVEDRLENEHDRVTRAHKRIGMIEREEAGNNSGMIEAFRMAMEWKDALRIILLPKVVLEGVKEALLGGDPALGMLRAVELLEREALAKVKGESLAVKGTIKNLAEMAKMIAAKIKDDGIPY